MQKPFTLTSSLTRPLLHSLAHFFTHSPTSPLTRLCHPCRVCRCTALWGFCPRPMWSKSQTLRNTTAQRCCCGRHPPLPPLLVPFSASVALDCPPSCLFSPLLTPPLPSPLFSLLLLQARLVHVPRDHVLKDFKLTGGSPCVISKVCVCVCVVILALSRLLSLSTSLSLLHLC